MNAEREALEEDHRKRMQALTDKMQEQIETLQREKQDMENAFKLKEAEQQKQISSLMAEKQRIEYDQKQREWQLNAELKDNAAKFDQ